MYKRKERRNQILSQLAEIHDAILNQLQDASETAAEVYALLDTVTSLAEAASIQASTKLTDHLVACGELMSTHILTQLMKERGLNTVRFDIRDVLRTDSNFGRAERM